MVKEGNLTNVVVVTTPTNETNTTNNGGNNTTQVDPICDLVISKTVNDTEVLYGESVEWTITVVNNGPSVAKDVVVTDTLPSGAIVVGAYAEDVVDGVLTLDVGDLDAYSSIVIKVVTQLTTEGNNTNFVVVNTTTNESDYSNNNANNTTFVVSVADLQINKAVSNDSAHKGDIVTWTITVTNNGPNAAVNVTVTDVIPDELIYNGIVSIDDGSFDGEIWFIDEVASGETLVLVINTTVDATNITIVNNVNVTSDTYDPNETNNNDTNETVVPPEADLEITKVANVTEAHIGDVVEWTIVITNNGPDAAVNVTMTDVVPSELVDVTVVSIDDGSFDGNVWSIDRLESGDSLVLVINTTVDASNVNVTNVVNVTSDTYDPNETNNKDNDTVEIPPEADLEVTITNNFEESGTSAHKGDEVVWTITVTNHGPDDAINTILKDILPDGIVYVSHENANGTYDNETAVWTIGDLPVGETVTLTIKTIANATKTTINRNVSVSSDTYDPDLSNNKDDSSVDIVAEADLEIIKLVSDAAPHKGDKITWTIIVTNNGVDDAANVVATDKLPSGVVYVSDDSNGAYDYKTGIWTVGDLANGECATLNIVALVDTTNATIVNVANVTSDTYDPNETNNKCNNSTTVPPEADLVLTIEPSATLVTVGDKITFTVTVVNQGPDTAVNSRAFINIPDELKLLGFKPSKGTYDPKTGIWTIGDLAPGEKVTLLLDTQALATGKFVVDAYTVCDTYETDYTNNNDTTEVEVIAPPDNETEPEPPINVPVPPKMHATGNPIVMVLLSLLAIVGMSLKRKS